MKRIACSAVTGTIFLGVPSKDGTHFIGKKDDVTSNCLKAVIEHVGDGQIATIHVAGTPTWTIEVRRVKRKVMP